MMALASDNALGDILKTPPNGPVWIFISNLMAPFSGWFDLNRIEPRSANMGPNYFGQFQSQCLGFGADVAQLYGLFHQSRYSI